MPEAQAVHERAREVERADVLDGVVAEVEVREAGALRDEDGEGDGAGGLALVAAEDEGRERGAEVQALREDLDAAVVQAVEAEVEVAQRVQLGEPRLQQDRAVDAHVVAAEVQGGDGRARAQGVRDDGGAAGAEVAVAAEAEALEAGALLEHADEAVRGARAAVQGDVGEAGALGELEELLQDDGPLGQARHACVREPPALAHAHGRGQVHGVDGGAQGLGAAAQEPRDGVRPDSVPHVRGDAVEELLEGGGVEHWWLDGGCVDGRWKWQRGCKGLCWCVRCVRRSFLGWNEWS